MTRSILWALPLLCLVAAGAARADRYGYYAPPRPYGDVPQLFGGVQLDLTQPFGDGIVDHQPLYAGHGLALTGHIEWGHFYAGAELGTATFANDTANDSSPSLFAAARLGAILTRGEFAPYVAVGPIAMSYGAVGDDAAGGWGISTEAGLLMFRTQKMFRATLVAQLNVPVESSYTGKGWQSYTSLPWGALALRLEL